MEALWFAIAWLVLSLYVVMDGFDFGAGALHLWVAKKDRERRQVIESIGPYWDGNEVWLLVFGGTMFLAFPKVLASGLSGFYLAVMILLWVLILRGISIEFRSHVEDKMWRSFWDAIFCGASTLAPVLLGAAFANLVRGVPVNEDGWFALSLFESFSPRGMLGILDWYTTLAGVFSLAAIAHHGALYLAWKTEGAVRDRSVAAARHLFIAVIVLWGAVTAATAVLAPELFEALALRPLAWVATGIVLAGLATSFFARRKGRDLAAFLGSSAFVLGLLAATAASTYPTWIRSIDTPSFSLTATNAAASRESLTAGLAWWPAGFVLAVIYFVVLFRMHRGRVRAATGGGD